MPTYDVPSDIRAIPTEYRGIKLRSRLEAQTAYLFDCLGWEWEYEPRSILLPNGIAYTPDFLLYGQNLFVECRGYFTEKGEAQTDSFGALISMKGYDLGGSDCIYSFLKIGPVGVQLWSMSTVYNPSPCCLVCYCCRCHNWRPLHPEHCFCQWCLGTPGTADGQHFTKAYCLSVDDGRVLLNNLPAAEWLGLGLLK